jgi:hypothetical protein
VPAEESHYEISYCCYLKGERVYFRQFQHTTGRPLDPSNGTIRRLSLVAGGFRKTDPIFEATSWSYGPVELGSNLHSASRESHSMTLEIKAGARWSEARIFRLFRHR